MATGTIKTSYGTKVTDSLIWAGTKKIYFFIAQQSLETTFNELREGDEVTFDESMGPKGPCAENVSPS